MKTLKVIFIFSMALLIAACNKQTLDGVYSDPMGVTAYSFKTNGKVGIGALGSELLEATYEIDGNNIIRITVKDPNSGTQQVMTMNLMKDGTIQGPLGLVFRKQQSDREAQPANSYAKPAPSPGERAAPTASPVVRQGTVQTFRRDANGRLINLGSQPSPNDSGNGTPSDVKKVVLNNLRQLSAAADQFYLENGVSVANYDQLVGSDKYVKQVRVVDGEDYRTLVFKQGGDLLVTTRTGLTIRYAP